MDSTDTLARLVAGLDDESADLLLVSAYALSRGDRDFSAAVEQYAMNRRHVASETPITAAMVGAASRLRGVCEPMERQAWGALVMAAARRGSAEGMEELRALMERRAAA